MKIRTDFVTNSSSSSFVSYKLNDSEFCRFVYQKMQENDLNCEEYSENHPGSNISFAKDSLTANISLSGYELNCDRYAPEVFGEVFAIPLNINDITNHIKDLDENFKNDTYYDKLEFEQAIYEAHYNEESDEEYRKKHGSNFEFAFCVSNDLCAKMYNLINTHQHDETITEYNGGYRCNPFAGENWEKAPVMDIYSDRMYMLCNSDDEEYGGYAKECDIRKMTRDFLSLMSEFLPLDEIDEYDKAEELFDKDKAKGKFTCDVYMEY